MTPGRKERFLRCAFRTLLRFYPKGFREELGRDMEDAYVDRWRGSDRQGVRVAYFRTLGLMVGHSIRDGVLEHLASSKEKQGTTGGSRWRGAVLRDARHAFRGIRKRPVFYSVVLLVFAVGIGANTVIFSVVKSVLLDPLPYAEPHRLIMPWQTHPGWLESDNPGLRARWDRLAVSYPVYENWLEMSPVFEELGIYTRTTAIATGGDRPELLNGAYATFGVFQTLGIEPLLGRTFLREEDRTGGPRLAVLSFGLWVERFGSDPGAVGKTMVLDEEMFTVVGVMPRGFDFPGQTRLWLTLPDENRAMGRNNQFASAIARLGPGVTLASAQADMEVLAERLKVLYPIQGRDYGVNLVDFHEETVGEIRPILRLLLGSVVLFLLIGCANIASLLFLRASERVKELAVRVSLGAGRKELFSQLLTEGIVLSAMGGSLGLLFAMGTMRPFLSLLPAGTPGLDRISVDWSVLTFSLALSVVTGILVSVIPGLLVSGPSLSSALKDSGRGHAGGRRGSRSQTALLVSEFALTFVLLVGAGLLVKSLTRLTSVDTGFSSNGIIVLRMDLAGSRYPTANETRPMYEELRERVGALPGVTAVALARPGPFFNGGVEGTTVETREGLVETHVSEEFISGNYFGILGMRILDGRMLTPGELEGGSSVVVVNELMADSFWPGENPIGQRVNPHGEWLTVVGVVSNVHRRLDSDPFFTLFHPPRYRGETVIIKTEANPAGVFPGIREALRTVDPNVPIIRLSTLDSVISETVTEPRVRAILFGCFALFAAFLAVLGIFGLLAQVVSQRTNEIGIRMALGAGSGSVMKGILARGMVILSVGLSLGLVISLVAVRVLEPFLFEIEGTDPATLLSVAALLCCSSVGASMIPARRAMSVDPVEALRAD